MIEREEAVLLFEKWSSEDTLIRLRGRMFKWSFEAIGKIVSVKPNLVRFEVGSAFVEFDPRTDDFVFEYVQPGLANPEVGVPALGVGLPLRASPDEWERGALPLRDKLLFAELIEPEQE
jgi:hypothetical protein